MSVLAPERVLVIERAPELELKNLWVTLLDFASTTAAFQAHSFTINVSGDGVMDRTCVAVVRFERTVAAL